MNPIIEKALCLLQEQLKEYGVKLGDPATTKNFLRLRLAALEHEEFHVLWLNSQNQLIAAEAMFRGTLSQTSVYPREVVKTALKHNACACIFAHNHPGGTPDQSSADELLTNTLKKVLALVDVRVLDHIIVAGNTTTSFAEKGLL